MGLLTDTKQREKFVTVILRYNNKLSLLFYVVGVAWFLALACPQLNGGTYFSENALSPGLVEIHFSNRIEIQQYYDELKLQLEKDKKQVPRQWLYEKMMQLGLDVYMQNFSISYPLKLLPEGQVLPGVNVYGILRAPRASGMEALVLTAPFRPLASPYGKTGAGIALMLGMIEYFKKQTYWAKDIIFLVTEHEHVGMQAWLDGYHGNSFSDYVKVGELPGRSGSIQAAVNIELPLERLSHVDVKMEGLNGQLPNLDLFCLVVKMCGRYGLRPMLHRREDPKEPDSYQGYVHSLKTMLKMMWHQAPGLPTGNHGLFHKYHIEAVTLEGVKRKGTSTSVDLDAIGRTLESIFRSLNNLLERFHQSFFFYLLPATNRYVSIGLYMPPFGIILAAALIKAIALWISPAEDDKKKSGRDDLNKPLQSETQCEAVNDENEEEGETEKKADDIDDKPEDDKNDTDVKLDDKIDEKIQDIGDDEEDESESQSVFVQIFPVLLLAIVMGPITYSLPDVFAGWAKSFRLRTDDALIYGLLALFFASLMFPNIMAKKADAVIYKEWKMLKCVMLIALSLILAAAGVLNISLAFFLAVAMVPAAVIVQPVKNVFVHILQSVFLLCVSPPALLYIACVIETLLNKKPTQIIEMLSIAGDMLREATFISILDGHLIGNSIYTLASYAVMPCWLIIWCISRA